MDQAFRASTMPHCIFRLLFASSSVFCDALGLIRSRWSGGARLVRGCLLPATWLMPDRTSALAAEEEEQRRSGGSTSTSRQ